MKADEFNFLLLFYYSHFSKKLFVFCLNFLFAVLLALIVLIWNVSVVGAEARRPPNYHHDQMPDTTFTCAGKVVGGYYADPDADCQMFHVCVQVDENDVSCCYYNPTD